MWNFGLVNVGFFSLPHLLQRTYAARDLTSLKWGYSSLSVGAFFTWLPGIFLGTVGVQMLADAGVENPSSPFASVLEQVMALGGFAEVVGVIAFTASLAAIMSTADSIIIAIR
jgi:Na+/proline symporter